MASTLVTGPVNNINNEPFANKWIRFTLGQLGTDATAGVAIAQSSDSVQTDAAGDFNIAIWDNGESGKRSILEIKVKVADLNTSSSHKEPRLSQFGT